MDAVMVLYGEWMGSAPNTKGVQAAKGKVYEFIKSLDVNAEQYDTAETLVSTYGGECKQQGFEAGFDVAMGILDRYRDGGIRNEG